MHSSRLFKRQGYIPLREYVEDIRRMMVAGPWKLPIGLGDRMQLLLLSGMAKFSWFADALYVRYPFAWSPAYSILVAFLERKGILDTVRERASYQGGYYHYHFQKSITIGEDRYLFRGRGIDKRRSVAFSKGLGEIIERMVSGVLDENRDIVRASPREMVRGKHQIVYPPRYHRFLPLQLERYRELHRDATHALEWVWGENIVTRQRTAIPVQLTSWFKHQYNFREVLAYPTSSGSAGFFTEEGALLRGMLEVVERDAFLVHWLTRIAPRVIVRHTLPEDIQDELQEFETQGLTLFVLDTTALMLPSVCIAALNERGGTPMVIVSGASDIAFESAVRKALLEIRMLSVQFFQEDRLGSAVPDLAEPFVSALDRTTRPRYWRGKERVEAFRWFVSGESITYEEACAHDQSCSQDDDSRLRACLVILKKQGKGYYPIVYRPKNDLQNALGFFVVQVFISKAFPLYLVEHLGTFESVRLQEFAESKGVTEWQLNPLPHMFT